MTNPQFWGQYGPEIWQRTLEHLWLSLGAVLIASVLAVGGGILVAGRPGLRQVALTVANTFQTVPSLALFGFLMPVVGLGAGNALVALVLYSLLPILRNTVTGLLGVDAAVREAAQAMGMSRRQVLWQVELPLAANVIMAGIRTATVICIGVTTIASFIGAGGLGELIQAGLRANDNRITLAGAAPAALLALLADGLLGYWQHRLDPMRSKGEKGKAPRTATRFRLALAAATVVVVLLLGAGWALLKGRGPVGSSAARPPVVVASKEFTESRILAEILKIGLEKAGVPVVRGPELGGNLCHQALLAGKIDVYPEYTGTAYINLLQQKPGPGAAEVYERSRTLYASRFQLEMSLPLGFSNGFAMLIRGQEARRLKIATLSQAKGVASGWKAAFGPDFIARADGWPGLKSRYQLELKQPPQSLDLGLLNRALASGKVDLIAGNETDGTIESLDLFQLRDDRSYFPPYEGIFVYRRAQQTRDKGYLQVLNSLSGALSTRDMRRLNYAVDGQGKRPQQVAAAWWDARR